MSLWLAFLNNVVEGWEKIGLMDVKIDALIKNEYRNNLEIFRHTVFHYQENYWPKMAEKHLGVSGFLEWAKNLDEEFEKWFLSNAKT